MNHDKLAELVAEARRETSPTVRRVVAGWAGIEAFKMGVADKCPFTEAEEDLVAGFRSGVEIERRKLDQEPPVFERTRFFRRGGDGADRRRSYADYSVPREED